jgi:hypothetical protein
LVLCAKTVCPIMSEKAKISIFFILYKSKNL